MKGGGVKFSRKKYDSMLFDNITLSDDNIMLSDYMLSSE
jgi:hypothetical protein